MIIIYSTTNVYGLHILQALSIVPGHGAADVGINSKQIKLNTHHSRVDCCNNFVVDKLSGTLITYDW